MKRVKIKPFGVLKITDEVLKSVEKNVYPDNDEKASIKSLINTSRRNKSGQFFGINPDTKEFFTFIPIIEEGELFCSIFPDPIQLYFSLAYSNYEFAKQVKKNITLQKRQKTPFNFVNSYLYNWHLKYKISSIIFLHSTVEAFMNYCMPDDFIYKQEFKVNPSDKFIKSYKELNKEQTERYILFKEKLTNVIQQVTLIDFQKHHKSIYDKLLNLNLLRNDIIHLRSTKQENFNYFQKVFDSIVNLDIAPLITAVKDFINTIKPNFIEIGSVYNSKKEKFIFNFENYKAFKFDISIFLQILKVELDTVVLHIPKSDDIDFQTTLNWILQNLDVMAEQNLIYIPKIITRNKNYIDIEITKPKKVEKSLEINS